MNATSAGHANARADQAVRRPDASLPRLLEAIQGSAGMRTRSTILAEGEQVRIARLEQAAPDRCDTDAGIDHALIVDLEGTADIERWRGPTRVGLGAAPHSVTTMSAGSPHTWRFSRSDVLHVHVPHERIVELFASLEIDDGSGMEIVDVTGQPDIAAKHLARGMIAEARDGPVPKLFADTIGLAFAQILVSRYSNRAGHPRLLSNAASMARPDERRLRHAVDYIEAHLDEDLSLAAIASAACMSVSWLKTSFRATVGKPVWAYVQERRLEHARLLLSDPDLSLAQIAYECGFSSHSHMTRLFKRRYGVPPAAMR
jgi:AraC-like DNA-binding protein